MDIYGLLGKHLGHSFSAQFFNNLFRLENIDAKYINFEIPDIANLPDLIRANPELRGFNVTIPYKESILSYLDDVSTEAQAIGAVNTVKVVGSKLMGFNTDAPGFAKAISEQFSDLPEYALILGSGGAAKAVCYALTSLGVKPTIVSRHKHENRLTYDDITPQVMKGNLLIINATPLGMSPNVDSAPNIPYHLLTNQHICCDLTYNPLVTRFMQLAAQHGASTANGLDMLHNQALLSRDIWFEDS